jgi:hypothetical protein
MVENADHEIRESGPQNLSAIDSIITDAIERHRHHLLAISTHDRQNRIPIFLQVTSRISDALSELAEGNEKRLVFGNTMGKPENYQILVEAEITQVQKLLQSMLQERLS